MRNTFTGVVALAGATLLLSACGGSPAPAPSTVTVTASTSTTTSEPGTDAGTSTSTSASASASASEGATATGPSDGGSSGATPTTDITDSAEPSSETSGPPIIEAPTGAAARTLTLSDVFDPGEWKEGSYQPASSTAQQQAMAASVYCSSEQTMELRFAQQDGTLTAEVAQDFRSPSSTETLEFSLKADGRQVATKSIPFKGTAKLTTPLAGVGVVTLTVRSTAAECKDSATALVTRLSITQ